MSNQKKLPEKGELVLGRVYRITEHGVYVKLIEYEGVDAYCHISEIANAWIRKIRNFVTQGQQVVGKVVKVQRNTNQVDISLKRLSPQQKKEKTLEYKRTMAAKAILSLLAEKLETTPLEIEEKLAEPLIENYYTLFNAFEAIAAEGKEALADINISAKYKNALVEVTKASVKLSNAETEVIIGLRSFAPDGLEQVKSVLFTAENSITENKKIGFTLTTIGSPRYRLLVSGKYFEDVDEAVQSTIRAVNQKAEELEVDCAIEIKETQ